MHRPVELVSAPPQAPMGAGRAGVSWKAQSIHSALRCCRRAKSSGNIFHLSKINGKLAVIRLAFEGCEADWVLWHSSLIHSGILKVSERRASTDCYSVCLWSSSNAHYNSCLILELYRVKHIRLKHNPKPHCSTMGSEMRPNYWDGQNVSSTSSTTSNLSSPYEVDNKKLLDAVSFIRRDRRDGQAVESRSLTPDTPYEPSERSSVHDLELEVITSKHAGGVATRCPPSPPLSNYDGAQVPLQNQILRVLRKIPGHEEKKGFLPQKELAALMTEAHVKQELHQCFEDLDSTTIAQFARKICGTTAGQGEHVSSFKKIFAILVLCEKPNAIPKFLEEDISDSDLPLLKTTPSGTSSPNIYHLARRGQQDTLKCFHGWSHTAVWRFEEWQWSTIAPFFHRGGKKYVPHLELQDQVALPFEQDSRFPDKTRTYQRLEFEGGFSNVFKVRIHPDHHDLSEPGVSCMGNPQFSCQKRWG